ncbi:MAG: hypothetical protein DRP78_06110 [Candidatus Omnitrophota bacterium]|nr:MAG: hypothetical protein DRP78_06110 [Candidatus Omnitrophota bacterium]
MEKKNFLLILIIGVFLIQGCASTAGEHRKAVSSDDSDRITVGKVQREIRIGMSSAEVAEILGSPNVVSTDEERREVWIYDKISTEVTRSSSEKGVFLLFFGGGRSSGAASKSQRTLTIIVKFDEDGKVRDFAYHTSRF